MREVSLTVQLDGADLVILKELFRWDAVNLPRGALRVPLRELSARTGLHRNTVQARLAAMRASGLLEGAVFEPLPAPLGLVRAGTAFDARGVGRAAFERALASAPNVSSAILSVDSVFFHSWHDDARDIAPWQRRIASVLGVASARESYRSTAFPKMPSDAVPPSSLEVRLMRELRRHPGSALADVGRRLGVSGRTAEMRAKRLIERGAGAMVPLLRPGRLTGALFVQYVAWTGDERARGALARVFPQRVIGPFSSGMVASVAVCVGSADELETLREKAEAEPGVGPVTAYIMRDAAYPRAFEAWLDERFASVQERVAQPDISARASTRS